MHTDIQYFAANYVAFQDNLTEDEKVTLIKWIKEAPDNQIKSLLITGDYVFEQEAVDEFDKTMWFLHEAVGTPPIGDLPGVTKSGLNLGGEHSVYGITNMPKLLQYIRGKWEQGHEAGVEAGTQATVHGAMQGLAAATVAALVVTVAYKAYKRFLTKAAKACKSLGGDAKTSCMNKYKRDGMKKQVADLSQGLAGCAKTKNPVKCKYKIDTKIRKLKTQLGEL